MSVVVVGPKPVTLVCPACKATVITMMKFKATTKTHLCALCMCILLCWPCSCVPYCLGSCRKIEHYCPHCKAYLGTFMR